MNQTILSAKNDYIELLNHLTENKLKKLFLVCDNSFKFLKIKSFFDEIIEDKGFDVVFFSDFEPNPVYESVCKGVEIFNKEKCDAIFAVGGGSAMDVAKCIKLFSNMDDSVNYLKQEIIENNIPLIAVPTTAGTGSEATRYAVIYFEGNKQSVTHNSIIPSVVLFDSSVLDTLPLYQKKSTLMDAFCHSIEAYWSVNSTDESKEFSKKAIRLLLDNYKDYLSGDLSKNDTMLETAYLAGKAINITQTTAGHAMCYKLTSLYGVSHGHAAGICLVELWRFMATNLDKCSDYRGKDYLREIFGEIASCFGLNSVIDAVEKFSSIVEELELKVPVMTDEDIQILTNSVNVDRLKNNPVALSKEDIKQIYCNIQRKA